jgi:hypothetical protein
MVSRKKISTQLEDALHRRKPMRLDALQLSRPVMGSATGLHSNQAPWQIDEELGHLVTPQLLLKNRLAQLVDTLKLDHILGKVDTYSRDFHDGCSCLLNGLIRNSTSAQDGAVNGGGVHPIAIWTFKVKWG